MKLKDIALELNISYPTVRNICSIHKIKKEYTPEYCPNCGCELKDR